MPARSIKLQQLLEKDKTCMPEKIINLFGNFNFKAGLL